MTDPSRDEAPLESNKGADRDGGKSAGFASDDAANDQTLRDGDQTLADGDQTQADRDQTAADMDRRASDDDQAAAADDQAASDRDLADGGDPSVHRTSAHIRNRSAVQRGRDHAVRSDAAEIREAAARARDLAAEARDQVSDMLDRDLEAVETRARAASDRRAAAEDRRRAARDREEARLEHEAMAQRLAAAETDPLTGAHARAPGLEDLDREIDRARRTTGRLAIAYVDVIGLKQVNDSRGHGAGDALLQDVVRVLRSELRSYDAIVRIGGDEFVCVMSGASTASARVRFDSIRAHSLDRGCGIKFGIAELRPEDDVASLVDRADRALPPGART